MSVYAAMGVLGACGSAYLGLKGWQSLPPYAVNPALIYPKFLLNRFRSSIPEHFPDHEVFNVPIEEDLHLEGIWLGKKELKKVIVFSPGMGGIYEEAGLPGLPGYNILQSLFTHDSEYAVVIINTRGIGNSAGFPQGMSDYKKDIKALWNHLTSTRGIDQENIVFYGHSLGCVGILGDYKYIILDRTFQRYLDSATASLGLENSCLEQTLVTKFKKDGWDADLESEVKDLTGVKIVVIYHPDDPTILEGHRLGANRIEGITTLVLNKAEGETPGGAFSPHKRPLTKEELTQAFQALRA